jgi:hypothetical protein
MPMVCIVTLQMKRDGITRTWRGSPDSRDWERLAAFKKRDGWETVDHRRDFIDTHEEIIERTDER